MSIVVNGTWRAFPKFSQENFPGFYADIGFSGLLMLTSLKVPPFVHIKYRLKEFAT